MIDLSRLKNTPALDEFRYEIKIPLDRGQFVDFFPNLYKNGLYPKVAFPDRQVNSVYCDTLNFRDYDDNVSGIGARQKTRLRWYNEDLSKLTLELKIKSNKASRKESISLDNFERLLPHTSKDIRNILITNKNPEAKATLASIHPVLAVQYNRQYFTLAADLRMTIDKDQKFTRLYPKPMAYAVKSPVYAVIEFKYPATERSKMQSILRNLPYRVFRHSKYVIGLDSTVG